jgi:hypothetical protein
MNNRKLIFLAVLLAFVLSPSVASAEMGWIASSAAKIGDFLSSWGRSDNTPTPKTIDTPPVAKAGAVGNDCIKRHAELADKNIQSNNALIDQMIKPSATGVGDMPCFDKYKNFSLSSMVGLPSLNGLLDQLKGQACNYVDQQIRSATQPINQSVWLPGGVGQVNTGVVFGQGGNVVTTTVTNSNMVLPQIFK